MKEQEMQIEKMAKILREECFYDLKEVSIETSERLATKLLEYYQPKLPEDSVANTKLFDEFVKFAKDKFNLTIVKDDTKKPITFEELFGKVFEDSVVLSRELLEINDVKSVDDLVIISRSNLMKKLESKEKEANRETAEKIYKEYLCDILSLEAKEEFIKQFGIEG